MVWGANRPTYSREFHRMRAIVKKRAQGRCEVLEGGSRCILPMVAVDHILNRAQGGSDDLGNLMGICKAHHDKKTQAEAQAGKALRSTKRPPRIHPGRAAAERMRSHGDSAQGSFPDEQGRSSDR